MKESIRRILREESKMSTYLRRRLEMLDYEVESRIGKGFYGPDVVCAHYENEEDLYDAIMESSIENMYWNYFVTMEEEWPTIYLDMVKYVGSKYGDEIINYYADNCFNKRKVMNLKETTQKKSSFFKRRIDLDEVKLLLPINSRQVYYETKSYKQFKYELTLRAVEAIMYNEYELGWEDLPEQEEIEFVTDVSNIFDKDIRLLYKDLRKK